METCPYCNEFMEIAAERADCPHLCADPRNEWCCLNCYAHFDLDLREVPIDDEFVISQRPSTPTQDSSTESKGEQGESSTGGKDNGQDSSQTDKDSSQESSTESSKGDSSTESKEEQSESKEESSQESSTGQKDDSDSKENPSQPQPPQNLTLANQHQIALAKQIYTSLKSYNNYTKINTDIIPIVESLQDFLAQDFLAQDFLAKESIA